MAYNEKFMRKAIELSKENIDRGGGPFGAVIVKDNQVIAAKGNSVTITNDPTAHAEVNTIREACAQLDTFDLSGCDIYSSCEPCPMCLSAIYWAHLDNLYYGNTKIDAASIGFDDSFIYEQLDLKPEDRSIPATQVLREEAITAFKKWDNKIDKVEY